MRGLYIRELVKRNNRLEELVIPDERIELVEKVTASAVAFSKKIKDDQLSAESDPDDYTENR